MKYLILILLLAMACKTPERLARERQDREKDILRDLQGRYADSMILAFPLTIPGGMVTLETPAPCPDFEAGGFKSTGGNLTAMFPCPDKKVNVDSILRANPVFIGALAGRRLAELRADSLGKANAVLNADNARVRKERNLMRWILGGLAVVLVGWMVFKFKTVGFGLLKQFVK